MTHAEVSARLASARTEAARRCGLGAYPAELIAVSERLESPSLWLREERAALELRKAELLAELRRGDGSRTVTL